jgi:hypothetical protein
MQQRNGQQVYGHKGVTYVVTSVDNYRWREPRYTATKKAQQAKLIGFCPKCVLYAVPLRTTTAINNDFEGIIGTKFK